MNLPLHGKSKFEHPESGSQRENELVRPKYDARKNCPNCQDHFMDISWWLRRKRPWPQELMEKASKDGTVKFKELNQAMFSNVDGCETCALFANMCSGNKSYYLYITLSAALIAPWYKQTTGPILAIVPAKEETWWNFYAYPKEQRLLSVEFLMPSETSVENTDTFSARSLEPRRPQWSVLRSALDECQRQHQSTCLRTTPTESDFECQVLLVDCLTRQITGWTLDRPYMAISYVWGNVHRKLDSMKMAEKEQMLKERRLPQTIEDAVQAVLALNHRFLWVDMLCLSPTEKHQQIQQMDKIYQNAVAVLVAVEGDSADFGIYGLSRARTLRQFRGQHDEFEFQLAPPSLQMTLVDAHWTRRGWTYQEFLLARQCIFLTRNGGYVTCRAGTMSEAVRSPVLLRGMISPTLLRRPRSFWPDTNGYGGGKSAMLETLLTMGTYFRRVLTYEEDALNAFRGALRQSGTVSFWGTILTFIRYSRNHPRRLVTETMVDTHTEYTEVCSFLGLLWTTSAHTPAEARHTYQKLARFPSWSWASCRRIAQYNTTLLSQPVFSLWKPWLYEHAEFYTEDVNGALMKLSGLSSTYPGCANPGPQRMIHEHSHFLYISHSYIDVQLLPAIHRQVGNISGTSATHLAFCEHGYSWPGFAWLDIAESGEPPTKQAEEKTFVRSYTAVKLTGRALDALEAETAQWLLLEKSRDHYVRVGVMNTRAVYRRGTPEYDHLSERSTEFDYREIDHRTNKPCPCSGHAATGTFRVG